jgi:hypothetical protein
MKRLVLFVVALVFAFCTTAMAADQPVAAGTAKPMAAGTAAPAKKEMKAKKAKKAKKAEKKAVTKDRIKKEENVPADAPK